MIDPSSRQGQIGHQRDEHSRKIDWRRDWQLAGCGLAIVLLLLAVEETWDEGFGYRDGIYTLDEPFFKFLHIYITALAIGLAYRFWKQERAIWLIAAASLAILFNPVVPIEIETWAIYYFIAAAGFAYLARLSPSVKAIKYRRNVSLSGSTASSAPQPEASSTVATQPREVDVRHARGSKLKDARAVGSDGLGLEDQLKPDPFAGWPRWLRWALFTTVCIAGALLLKPVGEVGGSIAGAVGAGGLVLLIGWPLYKLGTLLAPRETGPLVGGDLMRRLEQIAGDTRVSEARRDEARRRLAEMRTADR